VHLAGVFDRAGLDVDHWQLPLAQLIAEPDFPGCRTTPGVEVDRDEPWGLVGRLPGRAAGRSCWAATSTWCRRRRSRDLDRS
jgi:acetylornithine deacetylase